MSTVTGKTVSFNLYIGNALSSHDAAKKGDVCTCTLCLMWSHVVSVAEHLNPLESSIMQLSEGIWQRIWVFLRAVDRRHSQSARHCKLHEIPRARLQEQYAICCLKRFILCVGAHRSE